ncbi:NADH dehydrogenase [ubiquinone] 1 beta subcomplex subunit 8, mitochondrial [Pseudophryne corroboree]|uniref:NADH dehydrogenase [ubiquinone] 1 beta subcomplex subunit 8, mitochondrial n=1 Tax=Pseudophryne corroboree TaxID=495146 RepID=UPI0030814A7D
MAALRAGLLAAMTRRTALATLAGRRAGAGLVLQGCSVRAASDLPKDLLPGPYPKTEQERAAAAKKYNMLLEDYKPYPDDGMGYGDYPMLPDKSQEENDPWYSWDYPVIRRNFGEPMHWDIDKFIRTRVDTSPTTVPFNTMCKIVVGFITAMLVMFYIGELYPVYPAIAPKQYPYNNLYLERGGDPAKEPPEVKNYVFK